MEEELKQVKYTEPVEPDMFDRHMKKARENDLSSRCKVFLTQSKVEQEREVRLNDITPSIY